MVLLNDSPVDQEFFLEPDASYTVKVKQSRQYCKTPEPLIKTMNVKIKPVTLTFNNHSGAGILDVYLTGFSRDDFDLKGQIKVEYNYLKTANRIKMTTTGFLFQMPSQVMEKALHLE